MMYGRLTVNPISAAWNTVARFEIECFLPVRCPRPTMTLVAREGGAERAAARGEAGLLPPDPR